MNILTTIISSWSKTIPQAILAFTATNLDDIFLLTLCFSQTRLKKRHILLGQYLGFTTLIFVSLLGYSLTRLLPPKGIALLGLLPIALGLKQLLSKDNDDQPQLGIRSLYTISAITIANGGDNIGIYIPLFASSSPPQLALILTVFFILVALWCYLAWVLTRQKILAQFLNRYGTTLVPYVLIALGIYIIIENLT
jgi:cadmium resistance transport/sequestration family protein